jgi:YidC/Oxa1 family membrane protein insertase
VNLSIKHTFFPLASFDPSDAIAAASAAEAATLAAAKEGTWIFNSGFQTMLEAVHASTHLPWWAAIAATTVGARTLMLPVVGRQMRNTAAMSAARPEMMALQEWFKAKQLEGGDMGRLAQEYQTRLAAVWAKHDCHPLKSLAPLLLQAPLFIGFFSALRSMAAAGVPSLTHGGALWFPDLTLADASYGLPLASAAIFLLTVELGAADGMQGQDPRVLGRMKMFMRVLAAAMVPLTASMPAGVFVYWATSNAYSLLQALAFKTGPVRSLFGLQPLQRAAGVATAAAAPVGSTVAAAFTPAAAAAAVVGKPVTTYATRPVKKAKKKGRK